MPGTTASDTPRRPADGSDDRPSPWLVLEVLADDDCRSILAVLSEQPRSASALSEQCEIARSTTYRKLDRLRAAGLVEQRLRVTEQGPTASEYVIEETGLRIRCAADVAGGLSLSTEDPSDRPTES